MIFNDQDYHIKDVFYQTKILFRQKQHDYCQYMPDSSCFSRVCPGTWFPVPALCGGLGGV